MKTTTIATTNIEADISGIPVIYQIRIANGSPIRTSNVFNNMVNAIREMEAELGALDFDLSLTFGPHGITMRGETPS